MSSQNLKLADILMLYRALERDERELRETLLRIPEDRDYSNTIKKSIGYELEKLDAMQKEILSLPIQIDNRETHSSKVEKYSIIPPINRENPEIIASAKVENNAERIKIKQPRRY